MIIKKIEAENFLSFNHLELELEDDYTVIVGPNGSGKTNVLRLIEFVGDVLNKKYDVNKLSSFFHRRSNKQSDDFCVRVDVKLNDEEKKILSEFMIIPVLPFIKYNSPEVRKNLVEGNWNLFLNLTKVIIIVRSNPTNISYPLDYCLIYHFDDGLELCQKSGMGLHYIKNNTQIDRQTDSYFADCMGLPNGGRPVGVNFLFDIVEPLKTAPSISISTLLKNYIENHLNIEPSLNASDFFLEINWPVNLQNNIQQSFPEVHERDLINRRIGYLIEWLRQRNPTFGKEVSESRVVPDMYSIVATLFNSSVTILRNPRAKLEEYVVVGATGVPGNGTMSMGNIPRIMVISAENLVEILFKYSNEDRKLFKDLVDKMSSETHYKPFFIVRRKEISLGSWYIEKIGRVLEGQLQGEEQKQEPQKLSRAIAELWFEREANEEGSRTNKDDAWELPIELAPAGVLEMLMILTAVYNNKSGVVLLDEPGENLHPSWQHKLVNIIEEISKNRGTQFVIVTHSAPLVRSVELDSIRRFDIKDGSTQVYALEKNAKGNGEGMNIITERSFRKVPDLYGALFAKGALVCEGLDEVTAVRYWFIERSDINGCDLIEQEVQIIDAGGRDNILGYDSRNGKLKDILPTLNDLGIPFVAFCDGDTYKRINEIQEKVPEKSDAKKTIKKWMKNNIVYLNDPNYCGNNQQGESPCDDLKDYLKAVCGCLKDTEEIKSCLSKCDSEKPSTLQPLKDLGDKLKIICQSTENVADGHR